MFEELADMAPEDFLNFRGRLFDTATAAADALGVSPSTLRGWETGKVRVPRSAAALLRLWAAGKEREEAPKVVSVVAPIPRMMSNILDVDIGEASALLLSIAVTWHDVDLNDLPDLAPLVVADVSWARRRCRAGLRVTSGADERRQRVNRALFEVFKGESAGPQIFFDEETGASRLETCRVSDMALAYAKPPDPPYTGFGRPPKYTKAEIAEMALNADRRQLRAIARLKPRD